jgi:hypothetical protein
VTACEWCGAELNDAVDPVEACDPSCDCPPCENERALQGDADAYLDRCRD